MRRAFLQVDGRQIHYRFAGEGPPVVMLHPSPLSSRVLIPLGAQLARNFRVYAVDTPGYGLSDGLAQSPNSLQPYVAMLARILDSLGLQSVCLYGAATGAQIAIEFAKSHPQRVALLVADSAGHISEDDCERILRDYFPDVTPRADGAHLAAYWHMVRELSVFFPWCVTRADHRVMHDLPSADFMQAFLLDYLRAGQHYDWAYRVAFRNERRERARAVSVPTLLPRWEGSIALGITDALIQGGLPPNFQVLPLGATMAERIEGIVTALFASYRGAPAPAITQQHDRAGTSCFAQFVDAQGLQLHARTRLGGGGRPLLVVHSATESASLAIERVASRLGKQPIIAVDLPGFGDSDALAADRCAITDCAAAVCAALQTLGLEGVEAQGDGFGACVLAEVARQAPRRLHSLAVRSSNWIEHPKFNDWLARFASETRPRLDGAHLLAAWFFVRAQQLWSPPFDQARSAIIPGEPCLEASELHQRVVELLKNGPRATLALEAQAHYPLARMLQELSPSIQIHR